VPTQETSQSAIQAAAPPADPTLCPPHTCPAADVNLMLHRCNILMSTAEHARSIDESLSYNCRQKLHSTMRRG
jgi:hypothetical protein